MPKLIVNAPVVMQYLQTSLETALEEALYDGRIPLSQSILSIKYAPLMLVRHAESDNCRFVYTRTHKDISIFRNLKEHVDVDIVRHIMDSDSPVIEEVSLADLNLPADQHRVNSYEFRPHRITEGHAYSMSIAKHALDVKYSNDAICRLLPTNDRKMVQEKEIGVGSDEVLVLFKDIVAYMNADDRL